MLYRFSSRATAPFVMLKAHGRQMLDIIGKPDAPQGIITVEQMPAAIAAIEAAMALEVRGDDSQAAEEQDEEAREKQRVGIRQRGVPLLRMLQRSLVEKKDVTWELG
jgi:hypothetical protein